MTLTYATKLPQIYKRTLAQMSPVLLNSEDRRIGWLLGALVCATAGIWMFASTDAAAADEVERPNIVLIFTDDVES